MTTTRPLDEDPAHPATHRCILPPWGATPTRWTRCSITVPMIDHYHVGRDNAGEIASDPNRADDEEYIVRLVGQVVTVSVETMKLVSALPPLDETSAPPAAPAPEPAGYTQADLDAGHIYAKEDPPERE